MTADLSTREAAGILGTSAQWVREHLDLFGAGAVRRQPGRSGGEIRISAKAVAAYQARSRANTNTPPAGMSVAAAREYFANRLPEREAAGVTQ